MLVFLLMVKGYVICQDGGELVENGFSLYLYSMKLVNHIDDNKSINRTVTCRDFKAGRG
jgi:hypothetical protein